MPIFLVSLGPLSATPGLKVATFGGLTLKEAETSDLAGHILVKIADAEIFAAMQAGVIDAVAVESVADRNTVISWFGGSAQWAWISDALTSTDPIIGNDDLIGTAGPDTVRLLGGDDKYVGLGGNDIVRGGRGSDELVGGGGRDRLFGGAGSDHLNGGAGRDKLVGGGGSDNLKGGGGRDNLIGGGANDNLFGGAGADRLSGGQGSDKLEGGRGKDVLFGGAGADTFEFNQGGRGNHDRIGDFERRDKIEVDTSAYTLSRSGGDVIISIDAQNSLTVEGAGFAAVRQAISESLDFLAQPPIVLYGLAGKFDMGLNQRVSERMEAIAHEEGFDFREFEAVSTAQYQQVLRRAAEFDHAPIIAVGAEWSDALNAVASDYGNDTFVIVGTRTEFGPNVTSIGGVAALDDVLGLV